ncbi:hypothetical protein [Streptomyces sp. E-08]|uniref:hypothetical protein n=1 Tax=Streptomyces sp. E-08 TaxID=3404047 RepID=UPI003CF5470A
MRDWLRGIEVFDRPMPGFAPAYSVHRWSDVTAGLRELRRVTRPVTVLTCDPALVRDFRLGLQGRQRPNVSMFSTSQRPSRRTTSRANMAPA